MRPIRGIRDFVVELRRRHVFRVGVVYAVVAWAIVEVSSTIFPTLQIPEWTVRFVTVMAVLGFPVAIVLAWAFDLSPRGVIRTPSRDAGPTPGGDRSERGEGGGSSEPGRGGPASSPEAGPGPPVPGPEPPGGPSIAVLPFANMSGDPENEYFSDGITEDLIAQLARVGGLKVISRTSVMGYKGTTKNVRVIGRELGVTSLLEGSVRRAGPRVRIVAQLVDATNDDHLWAETYDRDLDDIFALQTEVAREIARELKVPLEIEAAVPREAAHADAAAYDLYLRGRQALNRRTAADLRRSIELFERAVDRDPPLARATAGLAEAHFLLGVYGAARPDETMPRAREAARRALEADGDLAEPRATLASILAVYDRDWPAAEAEFEASIERASGHPVTHHWFGAHLLTPLSRFEEARFQLERALELDPLSPSVRISLVLLDHFGGRHQEAVAALRELADAEPDFGAVRYFLGRSLLAAGRGEEAVAELERARSLSGDAVEPLAALGRGLAAAGREGEARDLLRGLERRAERQWVSPVRLAELHLGLGEPERALDLLERGLASRAVDLVWVDVAPEYDALRDHPRFRALRAGIFGEEGSSVAERG